MYKLDLHTHSIASPDGSLALADYQQALKTKTLDYIAITDHDRIDFAQKARAELGEQIIVGEEIRTREGEIIGLYLTKVVAPGLSLTETVAHIRSQGGLIYVPHPFETTRQGVQMATLATVAKDIAIVEVRNGRAFWQNRSHQAEAWARAHRLPGAAPSDAHGRHGWGRTYTLVDRVPGVATLPALCAAGRLVHRSPGLLGVLYPKVNRLRKGNRS